MSLDGTPEIEGNTHKIQQINEVSVVKIKEFTQPMELFTHLDEVDPMEITDNKTTLDKKPPRKCCHATARHPTILAALTSDRRLSCIGTDSTTPPH